ARGASGAPPSSRRAAGRRGTCWSQPTAPPFPSNGRDECDDRGARRRMRVVSAVTESVPLRRVGPARPTFARVAEEGLDAVHRYLLFLTGDRTLAEDLTGETFEKAFRIWRRFDPRRGTARTWACR